MAECLRCGEPAKHVMPVYNQFNNAYLDVPVCGRCYVGYSPRATREGGVEWKKTDSVKTWIVLTVLGSRRAAVALSALLDRIVRTTAARLYVAASAYVVVALSVAGLALLTYSTAWYILNPGSPIVERFREVYRSKGFLTGTGLPGLDPLLPLVEVVLPFTLAVLFHELGHALVLRFYGYDVKRVGLILAGPIPVGAYVEPPGSVEGKMSPRQAIQFVGAGVTANVLLGLAGLAAMAFIMSGLIPANPDAARALATYASNPQLVLIPPPLLSALGIATPMTAPKGWFTHTFLGDGYALPLSIASYMATVNFLLAIFNSLPIKTFDGGHVWAALLRPWLGPRRALITVNYVTAALVSMILYSALVVRV